MTTAEITIAAGQSNRSAVKYHFGDKDGLIRAVLEQYQSRIEARRRELIAGLEAKARPTLRDWVWALITPLGELLDDRDGEDYLSITAQLLSNPRLRILDDHRASLAVGGDHFLDVLDRTSKRSQALWLSRYILVTGAIFHGLADYSRVRRKEDGAASPAEFIEELINAVAALIERPASSTKKAGGRAKYSGGKTRRN